MYLDDYGLQIEVVSNRVNTPVSLPLDLDAISKKLNAQAFDLRVLLHGKELFYIFVTDLSDSVYYLHPKILSQDYKIVKSVLDIQEITRIVKKSIISTEEELQKLKLVLSSLGSTDVY